MSITIYLPIIILAILVGIVALISNIRETDGSIFNTLKETGVGIFIGGFTGFIIGFVLWLVAGLWYSITVPTENITTRSSGTEIVSMKDDIEENIHGKFILGTGTIDGGNTLVYRTYKKNGNKIKYKEFPVDETTLIEDVDSGGTAYYITIFDQEVITEKNYTEKYDPYMWGPFVGGSDVKSSKVTGYEIHIPRGTIIKSYELDLE